MTRETILKMQPGPEMDVLVAEKVMGYSRGGNCWFSIPSTNNIKTLPDDWSPSADISAAWEVFLKVDHDKERSKIVHLSFDQWVCCFDDIKSPGCKSAPEAICKAALLAMLEV